MGPHRWAAPLLSHALEVINGELGLATRWKGTKQLAKPSLKKKGAQHVIIQVGHSIIDDGGSSLLGMRGAQSGGPPGLQTQPFPLI